MDVKSDILYRYPFPIAVTYLNADNAREAVGAHDQRLRLFEVVLKYLSAIAIAQYARDQLGDARVQQTLRGLVRPSLGQWNGFLREVLGAYRRARRIDDLFISELFDAYNKKRKDRPAMARAYNEIINFVQNRTDSASMSISLRQFCDAMISYRNKTIGHGAITRYHCERMNEPLFDALDELLGQLDFLKAHRLVYIEEVRVRRGSFAHEMMSFMGSTPPARMKEAYITDHSGEYRWEKRLYLCKQDENVPVLSLHPWVIAWQEDVLFLNASEHEQDIEYLSYQSGQIKKPDRLAEDFAEALKGMIGDDQAETSFDPIRRLDIVPSAPVLPLTPFERGNEAFDQERWAEAIEAFNLVDKDDAHYVEAQHQQDLAHLAILYNQVQSHIARNEWKMALESLDQINDLRENYRDVPDLIIEVRSKISIPCPRCGTMTPSGYKFCGKCGAPIQSWICWRCQSPVPEQRKFCGRCGAPRGRPKTVACPRCGHQNMWGRKFCGRCGLKLKS
jgi:hypothetical protein